jgi:hypothetical protein
VTKDAQGKADKQLSAAREPTVLKRAEAQREVSTYTFLGNIEEVRY